MPSTVDDALRVLLSDELEPIVELVATRVDEHTYQARAVDGRVQFRRIGNAEGWRFELDEVDGRNPLQTQATDRFNGLADEHRNRFPTRITNSYPHAFEQIAQVFDADDAPDMVVFHTASHHWADQGGHIGEHGSLDVIQARAPFIVAGRGAAKLGRIDGACQLIDVAPTLAALCGVEPHPTGIGLAGQTRPGALLARQDGTVRNDVLEPDERPATVLAFLLDGTNANVLYDAIDRGDIPNIASLAANGTTFGHGAFSSVPTVTLANHTTALTGCHPGHHGILHNAWWRRSEGRQIITNDAAQWATAMQHLRPDVETLHEAIHRSNPTAFTVSINEPCDRGASFSTFELIRQGVKMAFPRTPELPHTSERFVRPFKDYAWYSRVDHHGMEQAVGILGGQYLDTIYPTPPTFMWVNITLTDSAFHEGGPYSEIARASLIDTDGRVGEILAALDQRVGLEHCAVAVLADHGMEESNTAVTGDWDAALTNAGIDFHDEAYGFIYLNP